MREILFSSSESFSTTAVSISLLTIIQRPSQVREYLENEDMPVWGILEDDGDHAPPRQSYNFAPGYHGLVYREDVPDWGAGPRHHKAGEGEMASEDEAGTLEKVVSGDVHYKLQSMKWGM